MSNELGNFGSKAMRVYDSLVPKTGLVAPTMDADFVGQSYTDTITGDLYIAFTTGNGSSDWVIQSGAGILVNLVSGEEGPPIASADYVGQISIYTVPDGNENDTYVYMSKTVGNGSLDWQSIF